MKKRNAIQTTLGELVVALTDQITPFVNNEREKNVIVAHILSDILKSRVVTSGKRKVIAL